MNILVCDDDKEIAGAVEIYLRNEGYTVFKAYDGVEALNAVRDRQIHLIIMDVMMPKMDGVQATMKIREEKNIPIIMLSAKSEDYDKITGLNVGADDYITKPFNPLELIARVRSQLRRYVDLGSMEKKTGVYKTGGLEIDDEEKNGESGWRICDRYADRIRHPASADGKCRQGLFHGADLRKCVE